MTQNNKRSIEDLLSDRNVESQSNLTVAHYFTRYQTPDETLDYTDILRKSFNGLQYAEAFFENVKNGLKIINPILVRYDKAGDPYAWLVFANSLGTKLILEPGIKAFVKDYQNQFIKPDFDLYDLIEEAKRLKS